MRRLLLSGLALAVLSGCAALPEKAFMVNDEQVARRQVETRKYHGIKEEALLIASSNVLQDMGFTLENTETKLGVLTASKQRDATDTKEIVGAIALALLGVNAPLSVDQTIRVSLVVRPLQATSEAALNDTYFTRITFQRIVRRTDNSTIIETLKDESLYTAFFDQLSKSVFLEAQKI
ncbi:hypothetical protein [Massilia timonae]|uniref:hypothetical protein n=1 Tax=Massilia timonae TaxID=47229 RepID=UPI00289A8320|nr:hypothetical protein [Massilia timonae]